MGSRGLLNPERCRLVQGPDLQVIRSVDGLSALAAEWNDLVLRCPGYFLSQTSQWAETAWETVARPRGRELNCITLRSEGRLVAVWPLAIRRDRGLRTLRPLGFEGSEYSAPLVEPGGEAENRTALLWRSAVRSADLAVLPHVRADGLLAGILKEGSHRSFTEAAIPAPYVARGDYPDWAAYHATISSQLRYQIRRRRKKLAEHGEVVLGREPAAGCAALIDWMLQQKKRWVVRENLTNDWIGRPEYRDFLVALATREDTTGGVALFALKVGGVPVAAWLVSVDRSRVEYYLNTYDSEWSPYSPGNILIEYVLQWTFERGLDFDCRIGDEAYKYKWAKRSCDTATWHIAVGKRGIPAVALLHVSSFVQRTKERLRLLLPPEWRRRLKALLGRPADPPAQT